MHAAPLFDTPSFVSPLLIAAGVIFVGGLISLLLAATSKFGKRHEKTLTRIALAWAVISVALFAPGVGFTVFGSEAATHTHSEAIATWLHDDYAATINGDDLDFKGEDSATIPATVHGKPVLLKLVKGPDGHVVAFKGDDTPLEPAN